LTGAGLRHYGAGPSRPWKPTYPNGLGTPGIDETWPPAWT